MPHTNSGRGRKRATVYTVEGGYSALSDAAVTSRSITMLGPAEHRRLDQPIAVSLEELVPADTFSRHLDAQLDLGFVREWVSRCYAERGRPSIAPVVFFTLQLVMVCAGPRYAWSTGPSAVC